MKTYLWLVLVSISLFATDNWYCTNAASEWKGTSLYTCGLGSGDTEAEARENAYIVAKQEFDKVCKDTLFCKGKETIVRPERNQCYNMGRNYHCHRLLVFEVTTKKKPVIIKPRPLLVMKTPPPTRAGYPKMYRGQPKDEFLRIFGEPDDAFEGFGNTLFISYSCDRVKFCSEGNMLWSLITIDTERDIIINYKYVNYKYTNMLN